MLIDINDMHKSVGIVISKYIRGTEQPSANLHITCNQIWSANISLLLIKNNCTNIWTLAKLTSLFSM